jgi:aryl-alcohol dehydrogenase-like predicted oxidoreductase
MIRRAFGNTGFEVSALGFGAGHIGSPDMSEDAVGTILNRAVDLGINLIDTARGYGLSEERVGRHLSWRRNDVVISTKGGYGVPGVPDWTAECITNGINQALERLQTDYIDIFHLHSCPVDILEDSDVIPALEQALKLGQIRVAAYSGENEALAWAATSGKFGSLETSVNICDQRGLETVIPNAVKADLGIIAKRPIANAPWRYATRPVGNYCETYWERLQTMKLEPEGLPWDEFALRFSAFAPGVSSAIVGTSNLENLARNVEIVQKGALDSELEPRVRTTFRTHDQNWIGQI